MAAMVLGAPALLAQTCTWIDPEGDGGVWEDAQEWDCGRVPGLNDSVVITDGPVRLTTSATVQNATLQAPDAVRVLVVEGSLNVQGNMILTCCGISHSETDPPSLGSVSVAGDLTIGGPLANTSNTLSRIEMNVNGDVTHTYGPGLFWEVGTFLANGSTLTTNGTFDFMSDHSVHGASGSFFNTGILRKAVGGTNATQIASRFGNTGIVRVDQGTLIFSLGGDFTGPIEAQPGTTTQFGRGSAGLIADVMFDGGTSSEGVRLSGGHFVMNRGTLESINTGLTVAADASMEVEDASATLIPTGPMVFDGTLDIQRGTVAGPGELIVNGALFFAGFINRTLDGVTVTANGIVEQGPGSLTLANGSTFTSNVDYFAGANVVGNGTFNNAGFFTHNTSLRTISDVAFNNTGIIENPATRRLRFTGALNNEGIIQGAGFVDINGTFENPGTISPGFSPGRLTIEGDFSNGTLVTEMLDSSGPGAGHDLLDVTGAVELGGVLELAADGLTELGKFTVLTCQGNETCLNGAFEEVMAPQGLAYDVVYGDTNVDIVVTQLPPIFRDGFELDEL